MGREASDSAILLQSLPCRDELGVKLVNYAHHTVAGEASGPVGGAPRRLGARVFTAADQLAFAEASRDVNPMHMDAVAARRLLSGRQVVHGIHTVLQALDLWQWVAEGPPASVRCSFDQPINVGDCVEFWQVDEADWSSVRAVVDGVVCTEMVLETRGAAVAVAAPPVAGAQALPLLPTPLDEDPASQVGRCLRLGPWGEALAAAYPQAARILTPEAVAALARLSYFVGMVCPGLHSVFSSLQFEPAPAAPSTDLVLQVTRYDPRFRLFIVNYDGPIRGSLRAFVRPPPQPQPSTRSLIARVRAGEFKDSRSLIVGGSRGLGEIVAKLLAAGGGDVLVSYAQGREDALRVAQDIAAAGRGSCEALPLDLNAAGFESLAIDGELSAVYYFATPRIYRKKAALFDPALFAEFSRFYLERFGQLCHWLEGRATGPKVRVYLPSTVFIAERPKGMTEYAMVKAAAEVLAEDLNRSLHRVEVVCRRLPRLATDQTASVQGVSADSNVESLLPILREITAAAS